MKMNNRLLGVVSFLLLFIFSCEKELDTANSIIEPQETSIHSQFLSKDFSKVIPHNFKVDWLHPSEGYSDALQTDYIEYPLIWTSNYNPERANRDLPSSRSYKLIVLGDDIYIAEFLGRGQNRIPDVGIGDLSNFSGRLTLYDDQRNAFYQRRYAQGRPEVLPEEKEKIESGLMAYVALDCYYEVTYYITDWYNIRDSDVEYSHSTVTEVSREFICYESGGGGGTGGGGGGGGDSSGAGDHSAAECEDPVHGCLYVIENEVIEPEDIKVCTNSFKFHDIGTTNWQAAGMKDVNIQFLTLGNVIGLANVHFSQLYIQFPKNSNLVGGYLTNHNARYLGVEVMTEAELLTNAYHSANPTASAFQLKDYFYEKLKETCRAKGGIAGIYPPNGFTGELIQHQTYYISEDYGCN